MDLKQEQGKLRSPAREWAARIGLMLASLLFAVLLAEGLSRIFVPISELRENITLEGDRIEDFVTPGSVYRQVSNEYDALTTITDKGHRVPEVSGNPDVVFIGDSFTFGFGLEDDQTFVSIYCRRQKLNCANLGEPGSGTAKQVDRLEKFLTLWHWRPREVRLFVFAMSGSFSAGNDFVDNYNRALRTPTVTGGAGAANGTRPMQAGGTAERVIGLQAFLLRNSNLVRLLKFYAGPMLKSMIVAEPGEDRMAIALDATRKELSRLDALSREIGFEYTIYLIVPVQDILRGTHPDTLAVLNSVSPKPVIATAQLYLLSPARYYFAFDGHLNPEGNRLMADFLVSRDRQEEN